MACGTVDVYGAAQAISVEIPGILKDVHDGDEKWFQLGLSSVPRDLFNHNSSF